MSREVDPRVRTRMATRSARQEVARHGGVPPVRRACPPRVVATPVADLPRACAPPVRPPERTTRGAGCAAARRCRGTAAPAAGSRSPARTPTRRSRPGRARVQHGQRPDGEDADELEADGSPGHGAGPRTHLGEPEGRQHVDHGRHRRERVGQGRVGGLGQQLDGAAGGRGEREDGVRRDQRTSSPVEVEPRRAAGSGCGMDLLQAEDQEGDGDQGDDEHGGGAPAALAQRPEQPQRQHDHAASR